VPIPVAQAGSEQAWTYSSLPKLVVLSGHATNTPILGWKWTMLYVPPGSGADVGVNGNFVNGVASIQNPSFVCDVVGCYVLQLEARNAYGWNNILVDRNTCQTPVYILSEKLGVRFPGAFLWKYDSALNATLIALETAIGGNLSDSIPSDVSKSTASPGLAEEASRRDHKHNISTGAPVSFGPSNAEGDSEFLARGNHIHKVPAFLDISDVPHSYSGQSGKLVKVKSGEDGLEFGVVSEVLRVVEIAQEGSVPYVVNLMAADSAKVFTTLSTTIEISLMLPPAAAGLHFTFIEKSTYTSMKIYAATGDTIMKGKVLSNTSPPSIWPFDSGDDDGITTGLAMMLVAINATEWVVMSFSGVWKLTSGGG